MDERNQKPRAVQRKVGPLPIRNPQYCIYCQKRLANTEEHVVAKCFFGSMQPHHNITVPACRDCNEGKGDGGPRPMTMDEEYTRTALTHEHNSCQHPVAMKLLDGEIRRSYANSPQFFRRIGKNMTRVNVRTETGIIIPSQPALILETERINRVLRKIVRGLFYVINDGHALPPNWPVSCSRKLSAVHFTKFVSMMDKAGRDTGWWNIGDETAFRFRCAMNDETSNHSVWLLLFYDAVPFFVHTMPDQPRRS